MRNDEFKKLREELKEQHETRVRTSKEDPEAFHAEIEAIVDAEIAEKGISLTDKQREQYIEAKKVVALEAPISIGNIEDHEEDLDDVLTEADRLAAEVEAEVQDTIGDMSPVTELTPEMLENMDPAQLQAFLAQMQAAQGPGRKDQSYYTRKQTPKAVKRKKRLAQKNARKITMRNGGGRTTPIRKRRRAA